MTSGVHSRLLSIALYLLADYNNSCSWLVLIQANYRLFDKSYKVSYMPFRYTETLCYIAALSIYMSVNLFMSSGVGRSLN